jgi:Protein of unknown function (DUF3995)
MTPTPNQATTLERVAGVLLAVGLLAGPAASHLYWMLGGTWGLHRSVGGHIEESTTTGIRVVAAIVLVLVVAAVLVVLARVGLWQQTLVSDRVIRILAWALAGVFVLEALAGFTYSREYEWWLYAPVALVLGLLALVVARSGAVQRHTVQKPRPQEVSSH